MSELSTEALQGIALGFLNAHRKAIFAFVDAENKPATSLMLYMIDDAFNVYFGTRKAFGKYAQVKNNPYVSLSVVEEALDPLRVADVRGVAEELTPEEQESVYSSFKSKNTSKYYVEGAEDFVMFRIRPESIRWADATSGELQISAVPIPTR
jgi:general stress protein 26